MLDGLFMGMLMSRMMLKVELKKKVRSLALGVGESVVIAPWVGG